MALRIAICGTTTQRSGTEEAFWLIVFDHDYNGINMDAKLKTTTGADAALMFRQGMNTYVGVMEQSEKHNGPWPCRGLYYHNDDGGPAGHVPRGTFNLKAYRIAVEGKIIIFDGSYSDSAVSGMHTSLCVVFDPDRRPLNHHGTFDYATNTLTVLHGDHLYVGKWATSNSNIDKWAGVFYKSHVANPTIADFNMQGCPTGTFLLYPTELESE
eukprot:TRINITY_DN6650_c0_g1_i1.p1 TRINITY_DN6650_c0_g1~~TRINITY_DN6650_c0_g1_i1.p1  ORF type:complete len:233 (+),score=47.25 TRINITY_DN6650_c0_g1_i1:64-699(+)